MRALALIMLALPTLLPAVAGAQTTLNKCIDAQGKVTYSNLPCRNARETRAVEIDPAPRPDPVRSPPAPAQPAKPPSAKPPAAPPAAAPRETAPIQLETRRTTGKPPVRTSARQCDAIADQLGSVLDKMDQARRKGYTQEQMDKWNREISELERKKQQSNCF